MPTQIIHIKNMVCPRCITTVGQIFEKLDLEVTSIQLGEVSLSEPISHTLKDALSSELKSQGFELLEDHNSQIISQIKALVIQQVHHSKNQLKVNFSSFLATEIGQEYSSISRLFSSIEGITIEKFILKQKIEKVKELMFYNQLTLSEIADEIGYSSVAHLSSQFKKETGMSPSQFKKLTSSERNSLDTI